MRYSSNTTIAIKWEVVYLSSNDAIANVIRRDLDLHFHDHKIRNVHNWRNGESWRKILKYNCNVIDIRHRMTPLQMLF